MIVISSVEQAIIAPMYSSSSMHPITLTRERWSLKEELDGTGREDSVGERVVELVKALDDGGE
jgi:hypothetical protein